MYVCSVEERLDCGYEVFESARTVNSELERLCDAYGATFIDLRPLLSSCKFNGINKTGLLYTFEASRRVIEAMEAQMSDFLD